MADCEGVESYVAATAIFGAVFGTACRSEAIEEIAHQRPVIIPRRIREKSEWRDVTM